ncbi:hypothetical protein [Microcystis phage Mae-JY09]
MAPQPHGSALRPRDPVKCTATNRAGKPCGNAAMTGTTVCGFHGGKAPQVQRAVRRRIAENKVRQALDEVGIREVENPLEELRALTGEVVAWKDALARHVAALEDRYRFTDHKGGEQLRAEVALYERAMDRAVKVLETWARLGIDAMLADLRVRVTEAQVDGMVRGLEAYRKAAQVPAEAHARGIEAMALVMRGEG